MPAQDHSFCQYTINIIMFIVTAILPVSLQAGSSLRYDDNSIVLRNPVYEIWGAELDPALRLSKDYIDTRRILIPLAEHGLNSVGFSVHHLSDTGAFFTPDGRSFHPEAAEQFKRFIDHTHKHGFITFASLFAADGTDGLASADGYRQAVQTVTRLLPEKHFVIFIIGDLFSGTRVSPSCPYPFNQTDRALELCRLMFQANPTVVVGLPAEVVTGSIPSKDSDPLFYATTSVEALEQVIDRGKNKSVPADLPPEVAAVDVHHFFRRCSAGNPVDKALDRYLKKVEDELWSLYPPGPEVKKPLSSQPLTAQEKAEGFVPLFDGKSLKEWTTLLPSWGHWSIQDKALCCRANGHLRPWLRSRKRYSSFILRLEYKLAAHGNSGIFFWTPLNGRASGVGIEVQLCYSDEKVVDDSKTTGAIYTVLPPREDATHPPGQWNKMEITCRGSHVQIMLNDRLVQDFDADQVPGLRNRPRSGVVGLQDHGYDVWFRNIRIKELPEPNEPIKP